MSPSPSPRKEQVLLEYGAVIPDNKPTLLPSIKKAQPEPSLMRMLYEERTLELPSLISKEATGLGAWIPSPPKESIEEAGYNSIADQIARRYVGGLARLEEERRVWRQRDAARRHRGFRSPSPPKHRLQALAPLQPLSAREEPSKRLVLPTEPLTAREVRFEAHKSSSLAPTNGQATKESLEKAVTTTSTTHEPLSRGVSDEVLSDVQWISSSKESSHEDCTEDIQDSSSFAKDLIGKLMTIAIIETVGPDEGKSLLAVQEDTVGPMQRAMLELSPSSSKKKEEVTFRRQRSSISSSSDGRHEDPASSSSVRRQDGPVSSSSPQRTRSSVVLGEADFIRNLSKKRPTVARSLSTNRLNVNPVPAEKLRSSVTGDVPLPETKPMPRKSVFDDCFSLARKYNFPLETIRTCMQDFKRYNVSDTGSLNLNEFKEVVRDFCDIPKEEEVPIPIVQGIWKEVDTNISDAVCFEEYVIWYMKNAFSQSSRLDPKERLIRSTAKRLNIDVFQVEDVYKTFAAVDCNGNGLIDESEFRKAFFKLIGVSNDSGISQNRMRQYWLEADANNNGGIGFEEFLTWYVRMGHSHSRRDLR